MVPKLSGHTLQVYTALNTNMASNYQDFKKATLCQCDIGEETYRQWFQTARRKESKAHVELATQLMDMAKKWLMDCSTADAVIEKLVLEQ